MSFPYFILDGMPEIVNGVDEEMQALNLAAEQRAVTGVLASHAESRDVHIMNLSITFHGVVLLDDTDIELNCGRRYGLIGINGCGKLSSRLIRIVTEQQILGLVWARTRSYQWTTVQGLRLRN